jgi:hypothetical protein
VLSRWAKILMMLQATISLATIAILAARAVIPIVANRKCMRIKIQALYCQLSAVEGVGAELAGHDRRLQAIEGFVSDAVDKGAEIQTGGDRVGDKGYFFAPTILAPA